MNTIIQVAYIKQSRITHKDHSANNINIELEEENGSLIYIKGLLKKN